MLQSGCLCVLITLFFITLCQGAVPEDEKSITSQTGSAATKKTDGLTINGKGAMMSGSKATPTFECVAEDTECTKDRLGYEAIANLHRLIDDDNNGNVDQAESDEFLRDELQYTDGFERHSLFHNNDKLISVDDLWRAWKFSRVYNWTVEEVVDWLVDEVELPQYSIIFNDNAVCGSFLPRIATSNTFMSTILGIKNPVHKQKLTLKAMDTVLFGPPPKRHNHLKDLALTISLLVAVGGCWFGIAHHRYSQAQVKKMTMDLEALQKAEDALTEMQKKLEDAESRQVSAVPHPSADLPDGRGPPMRYVSGSSGGSYEEGTEQMREELAATRLALQHAETQLGHGWAPPGELQAWLQLTHELELVHYIAKRQAAERQFQGAKEACEKIKRRNRALFGSLRMAHSNSVDEIDQRIVDAKQALEEVKQDLQERLQRWHTIERLCSFPVITNPGLATLHQQLYIHREGTAGSGRLMASGASSSALDEIEDDMQPAGCLTLPHSHSSKQFLHQRVLMGSTGSLSTVSRSGVGLGMGGGGASIMKSHYTQPSHPVRRESQDPDPPGTSFGTLSDIAHDHPMAAGSYSTTAMDLNRSFSLTSSIASANSATHHPNYHGYVGMTSNDLQIVPPAGHAISAQSQAMSLDHSDDNLSQATLDSLTPSMSGSNINNSLDHLADAGQGVGNEGGMLVAPRLRKKRSLKKKMIDMFKKSPKKSS